MKKLTNKALAISFAAIVGASALPASATGFSFSPDSRLGRSVEGVHQVREFRGYRPLDVSALEARSASLVSGARRAADRTPDLSFTDLPRYDYLEGPDGATWFYTAEYDFETVVHNPYWSEDLIKGFTFTIYDSQFNVVGVIKDKIEFAPNETRAREVLLDAAVTRNFFNTDDKLEVMVSHVMNTEEYVNHYYYKVYSIDGQKDDSGNDVSFMKLEGRCADAINVGTAEDEDFYLTFIADPVIDFQGTVPSAEYIEYLNTLQYTLTTYGKATSDEGPVEVFSHGVYATRIPGDTTNGVYFISKKDSKGNLYLVYSQYAKPYFLEPVLLTGDERATPGNSFTAEVYKVGGGTATLSSSMVIPVEEPDITEQLIYAYYSIGSVAWSQDVDMDFIGTPESPVYVVAHDIEIVATEELISNYELYDTTGTKIRTIAENTATLQVLGVQGRQPQIMFVIVDEEGAANFLFTHLYGGEDLFTLSQANDGDPLVASCALVEVDGDINYAFEMRNIEVAEDGTQYYGVAWFDSKGKFVRKDRVCLGKDVQAAMVNMDPVGLRPDIYDDDDAMEYAVLVKRTYGAATRNEFMVVDDNEDVFITFSEDNGRGEPSLFTLLPGETNRLMMVYTSYYGFNIDLYDLPFVVNNDESGIGDVAVSEAEGIAFDGSVVAAPGSALEVYNASGLLMRRGNGSVSVADLSKGVYVVVAVDAEGRKVISKIAK